MEKPQLVIDGKRLDGRGMGDLRPIKIDAHVLHDADGSAYLEWGKNKVICGVHGPRECIPKHDQSPYRSVVKCRYIMAPFSSLEEHGRSGPNRRSTELSKVIREVFENVIIAESYPKTQIDIYIDVLQSDGGTRCASITGSFISVILALEKMREDGLIKEIPVSDYVAAVSVGIIAGSPVLDLNYDEDSAADVDMNIIMTGNGRFIEVQGTAEREPFKREDMNKLIMLAKKGIDELVTAQKKVLKGII